MLKLCYDRNKGLATTENCRHQISHAIVAACAPHPHCTGNDFIVRIRHGSNNIIVSTPHEETARVFRRVDAHTLSGNNNEFNTDVAGPEGTLRGVIHGIGPGRPPEELLANVRVRTQGVKVHTSRVRGDTNTADITFDGTMIPPIRALLRGVRWRAILTKLPDNSARSICNKGTDQTSALTRQLPCAANAVFSIHRRTTTAPPSARYVGRDSSQALRSVDNG
ncbi:hypothetical protein MTO96_010430 [Rhipicephalus appendiculatus]